MFNLSTFKMTILPFFTICGLSVQLAYSDCKLCERIREKNAKEINPYEYYEDYLEAQKQGKEDAFKEDGFGEQKKQEKKSAGQGL
ncbi:hypothetical protein [Parachlamydia sp. AcF125]|uniref:hypothetical protein n=1 Tax=Parachlamydia sp. AcF125 TaxID=2795736 RepID=UPI001BD8AE4A|nr:hypothetical protein [Parachlamydia sp. AcF125]MBS4167804.1 hypothetical protein [Parachlamydia sp. AcF125]